MEQGQYKHVNALVVEHCLKWTKRTVPNNDQGLPYYAEFWIDEKGDKMEPTNFWGPASNEGDGIKFASMLLGMGYRVNTYRIREHHTIVEIVEDKEGGQKWTAEATVWQLALCLCALKTKNVDVSAWEDKEKKGIEYGIEFCQ